MGINLPADKFSRMPTPFYYYDLGNLKETLDRLKKASGSKGYKIHYAVKANANPRILQMISSYGFGADCVSWNEIDRALKNGFSTKEIVFAGVGKSDSEIESALKAEIFCFNCESIQELEVIDSIAGKLGKTATIALRINPYIEAHTHKHITTGIEESKFGIRMDELDLVIQKLRTLKRLKFAGIHFHLGSQILRMQVFKSLCARAIEILDWLSSRNLEVKFLNVGGGLGINYEKPDAFPDFEEYFRIFSETLKLKPGQELHFEPGRAVVAQCGSLISKVLYVKDGANTRFVVLDAGMTDLIRPALYQAFHKIENLTSQKGMEHYDIVGPVCESSDTFGKFVQLPLTSRGDIIAIRSAGAYGEVMASRYNLRDLPGSVFPDDLQNV